MTKVFFRSVFYFFLLAVPMSLPAVVNEITWVAPLSDNNMDNINNWSPQTIPGTNDVAVFNEALFVNTSPEEHVIGFTASEFQFTNSASAFLFNFNNQPLTLSGAGITGTQTNTTINANNTNNSSFLVNQVLFSGTTGTSGSAALNITNTSIQTGSISGSPVGIITNDQFSSSNPFSIDTYGSIKVLNFAQDTTSGPTSGGNATGDINHTQMEFGSTITAMKKVEISVINNASYSGSDGFSNSIGNLSVYHFMPEGQLKPATGLTSMWQILRQMITLVQGAM